MSANGDTPRLEMRHIRKEFPGCLANDDVGLTIMPGEIHALLGENGAGKSTLVKIIYGVQQADAGTCHWNGEEVSIANPAMARELGIGMVFQHFSLFEAMTVSENIALGMNKEQLTDDLDQRIIEVSETYGLPLDPRRYVSTLSVGERQRIEIVRCLLQNPKLLIMDEPTSVLTPQEVEVMFGTLRRLASEGVSILYISHKLDEIKALCHAATIMRGGKVTGACDPKEETAKSMAEMMIGTSLQAPERHKSHEAGDTRMMLRNIIRHSEDPFGTDLLYINMDIKAGEILGIAGIAGNGQTELMEVLSGEVLVDQPELIRIDGEAMGRTGPTGRRLAGLGFVPEERHGHGAVPDMSLWENALLSGAQVMGLVKNGFQNLAKTADYANNIVKAFNVKTAGIDHNASSLSGGNLQKFIMGREILQNPGVMIALQPTWGVDAGAAAFIHQQLIDLAEKGAAVLVISQDLDELFAISDKIAVLSEGKLSDPIDIKDITVEKIGLMMGGTHDLPGGAAADAAATGSVAS